MKKIIVLLSVSLMIYTLTACTLNTNKVSYDIPNDSWDLSPSFEYATVDKEGKEITYTIVGNEKTFGFTGNIIMEAEKPNKLLWFYFGNENILDKPIEVKGVKDGTEEMVALHSGTFYKGAEVGPNDVNMPSSINLPAEGVWKLLVYIDGELYESIVVEAKR